MGMGVEVAVAAHAWRGRAADGSQGIAPTGMVAARPPRQNIRFSATANRIPERSTARITSLCGRGDHLIYCQQPNTDTG